MLQSYLKLIRFSHTIFALPFALVSVLVATSGSPSFHTLFWVIIAMAGARSGAMGFNRWVDRDIDKANPRTSDRPSVTGEVSVSSMLLFIVLSYAILVFAAWQLNPLALKLSPVAIFLTAFYSLCKRFTPYSHVWLGVAIGSAPVAAWIAVQGSISFSSILLGLSVLFWIGGFDILYALQDHEYDKKVGLFSIPAHFGVRKSLNIAKAFHGITVILWLLFFMNTDLKNIFLLGIIICAALLVWEHRLVKEDDLSSLDVAFFNMNGYISVTLLVFTGLSYWL